MLKFQQKVIILEKYLNILSACPLFEDIAEENLLRMLNCLGARVAFFDKKYTIFAEGNPAKFIGIVLSGSVQMFNTDFYGNRSIVAVSEKGEMFGEAFACAEVESIPVSVIATEPSEIMLIDCSHILHTCHNNCGFHQKMIFNLMKNLAVKNIRFHQKIQVTSKRSTREKLMAYLMNCAKAVESDEFDIPFDRQELADYLGVERSGLSAELSKLRKEGVLENTKKHFTLLQNIL